MANIHFLFFLLFTFFPQLHARESQFFSKFTKETDQLMPTSTTDQQQEHQPHFIPQTKDSIGYGLYANQLPPSTTTNGGGATDNLPVTTFPETYNTVSFETTDGSQNNYNVDHTSTMYNNQKQDRFYRHLPTTTNGGADVVLPENYNPVAYTTPIHGRDSYQTTDNQYNMYNTQKVGMSGTRFIDDENMYSFEKQGVRDRGLDNGKHYHVGSMYNSEKQGMSDTRFMEDGKYSYDLNSERLDANLDANPRGNGFNNRGYYGNNDNSHNPRAYYYGNKDDSYNTRYSSNEGFQEENQEYVFNP